MNDSSRTIATRVDVPHRAKKEGVMDFKLILVFVDDEKMDDVLDAAREAGATGATIIANAQGQGLHKQIGIFGLEVFAPRTVLLILVEARRSAEVLEAVCSAGGLDESLNTGIAIELDVTRAVGLTEHIKRLTHDHPPKTA
jgi:nitrogen regulatory protein PII